MKKTNLTKTSLATALALGVCAISAPAQVVINEIAYDDAGTDDFEFVELYNAGLTSVDISGWTLGGRDNAGNNQIATIPAGTTIAAGGFYVIGNTAVNPNLVVAVNFLENDAEQYELWNGAFNASTLIDGFVSEANKGPGTASGQYGNPSTDMLAQIGGGYRGNYQTGHINGQGAQAGGTGPVLISISRFIDGRDTDVNGRDFGVRRATPGAPNSAAPIAQYKGPDVDSSTIGSEAAGLSAAFVNPRVVDPTTVSAHNPTAIPASPQGGNAVTIWDTEFGGTGAAHDDIMQGAGKLSLYVYVDPRLTAGTDAEEWMIGLGGAADSLHNLAGVTGTVNGASGLGWLFRRDATAGSLQLIDFKNGTPNSEWTILGTINLTEGDLGWHELGIEINGTSVTGNFDGTVFSGSTADGLVGNIFYASYREAFGINTDPLLRPLTIDMIPEPTAASLALLGGLAMFFLRRRH